MDAALDVRSRRPSAARRRRSSELAGGDAAGQRGDARAAPRRRGRRRGARPFSSNVAVGADRRGERVESRRRVRDGARRRSTRGPGAAPSFDRMRRESLRASGRVKRRDVIARAILADKRDAARARRVRAPRPARAGRRRRRALRRVAARAGRAGHRGDQAPSPSAGEILPGADGQVETIALAYRRGHAAAISVVTEEDHFGGRPEWLSAREADLGAAGPHEGLHPRRAPARLRRVARRRRGAADRPRALARGPRRARPGARGSAASRRSSRPTARKRSRRRRPWSPTSSASTRGTSPLSRRTSPRWSALAASDPAGTGPAGGERHPSAARTCARLRAAGYEAFLVGEALLRAEDPEEALRDLQAADLTTVKICGLTRPEDVELACELGAACLGFNFAAVSPRRVEHRCARGELAGRRAAGVARVGVFVDESRDEILAAIEAASLDARPDSPPALAESDLDRSPVPVIAAVARVRNGLEPRSRPELLARCRVGPRATRRDGRPGARARRRLDARSRADRGPCPLIARRRPRRRKRRRGDRARCGPPPSTSPRASSRRPAIKDARQMSALLRGRDGEADRLLGKLRRVGQSAPAATSAPTAAGSPPRR